jgi:hypothetical protein
MLRNAANKLMWVGRATVFMVGLAVILALVLGLATAAFGANGDLFKVGRDNFASAVSVLDKSGAGPALRLRVDSGAPMGVNSSAKVTNLNADKVDGHDAPLWAIINADGTTARDFGVTSSEDLGVGAPGAYRVFFNRSVSNCAYIASLGDGAGNTFQGEVSASRAVESNGVFVQTANSSGGAADRAFNLAVFC